MTKIRNILILTFLCLISLTLVCQAAEVTTRSIVGDYFNKVFEIELNDGSSLFESEEDKEFRQNINQKIYDGTIDKTYSLYDRFGGSIKFIPYFGEVKISTNLLDAFYAKFMENNDDFSLSAEDILLLFQESSISNNVVYNTRPNVLSNEDIEAGNMDPRVYTYNGISSIGGEAALGNFMLDISNFVTSTIAWLSGSNLYETINNLWQKVCDNGLKDLLQSLVKIFLPFSMCIFIISIVKKSVKTIKGKESGKAVFEMAISALLSLALIFSFMYNPNVFGNVMTDIVTYIDDNLDSALQIDADEVVKSENTKNVRSATIWKTSVFDPWCYGMFGSEYDKLYTQYDQDKNHIKMDQSHDDVKTNWGDETLKYDSASLTGDIKIQVGKDKYVRNWAALAWSTQSIYHIDAVKESINNLEEDTTNENLHISTTWPKAETTPMNDQIFVDNFRWVDAKLNISPEYYSTDKIIMNYSNSNDYEQYFIDAGLDSLWLTFLLIPIGILSFRKLINSLKIVWCGFKLVYESIVNIIMPEKYTLINNLTNIIRPLYDFFWWSMMIFVAIAAYSKLVGNGVVGDVVWIFISIWLCLFKPIRTPRQLKSFINDKKRKIFNFSKNIFEGLENKISKIKTK